jgi:hypothetical protein
MTIASNSWTMPVCGDGGVFVADVGSNELAISFLSSSLTDDF